MVHIKITEQIKLSSNDVRGVEITGKMVFSRGDGWFLEDIYLQNDDLMDDEREIVRKHLVKNEKSISSKLFTALDCELEERRLEGAI